MQDRSGVVVAVLAKGDSFCWGNGMLQRPFDLFWVPLMSTWPFFTMWTCSFVKVAVQLSSQNFLM